MSCEKLWRFGKYLSDTLQDCSVVLIYHLIFIQIETSQQSWSVSELQFKLHYHMLKIYKQLKVQTRYSKVRPISSIDLMPAETTAIGVLPSSVKSALMSIAWKYNNEKSHTSTFNMPFKNYLLVTWPLLYSTLVSPSIYFYTFLQF